MASLPSVDAPNQKQKEPRRQQSVLPVSKPEPQQEPIAEGYLPRRVDVKLSRKHAAILRDKLRTLEDAGAKLEDGTFVSDRTKAVLWILENEVA